MKRIIGREATERRQFFREAAEVAQTAECRRARCGTVIVKEGEIVGRGSNGPAPQDKLRCDEKYDHSLKPKYDKTCCVHAEWRAILNACKNESTPIDGSTLYFMRIDENGEFTDAGKPFCTVCSRLALESGISYFALWNDNGIDMYDTLEYNQLSYDYYGYQ